MLAAVDLTLLSIVLLCTRQLLTSDAPELVPNNSRMPAGNEGDSAPKP